MIGDGGVYGEIKPEGKVVALKWDPDLFEKAVQAHAANGQAPIASMRTADSTT